MKTKICVFFLLLAAALLNYFCLQEYYISELLTYPLVIWLSFSLVILFKPNLDKKNMLAMVVGVTCGVVISALLGQNMEWHQYVIRSVSAIFGGLILWAYVCKTMCK